MGDTRVPSTLDHHLEWAGRSGSPRSCEPRTGGGPAGYDHPESRAVHRGDAGGRGGTDGPGRPRRAALWLVAGSHRASGRPVSHGASAGRPRWPSGRTARSTCCPTGRRSLTCWSGRTCLTLLRRADLRRVAELPELVAGFLARARGPDRPALLAPFDLQVIRACGVTFAESLIERVIEEGARGDAAQAARDPAAAGRCHRDGPGPHPSGECRRPRRSRRSCRRPGYGRSTSRWASARTRRSSPRRPSLASVGFGDQVGVRRDSTWNNPEPEVVLALDSTGRIVGATLGNDVNLRDFEGRSALLLPEAKDNNASCSIGPVHPRIR